MHWGSAHDVGMDAERVTEAGADGLASLPDLMTVSEVAAYLRLGRATVYELCARYVDSGGDDGIPAVRIGRTIRIPKRRFADHLGMHSNHT